MYGEGTADEIVYLSNQMSKFSTEEIRDLASYYRAKVKDML
jgi:hypothetical protein